MVLASDLFDSGASCDRVADRVASDIDSAESSDSDGLVEVYFAAGREIDSRTGLPWGWTQARFDELNDKFQRANRMQQLIAEADSAELHRIITAASDRLRSFAC